MLWFERDIAVNVCVSAGRPSGFYWMGRTQSTKCVFLLLDKQNERCDQNLSKKITAKNHQKDKKSFGTFEKKIKTLARSYLPYHKHTTKHVLHPISLKTTKRAATAFKRMGCVYVYCEPAACMLYSYTNPARLTASLIDIIRHG